MKTKIKNYLKEEHYRENLLIELGQDESNKTFIGLIFEVANKRFGLNTSCTHNFLKLWVESQIEMYDYLIERDTKNLSTHPKRNGVPMWKGRPSILPGEIKRHKKEQLVLKKLIEDNTQLSQELLEKLNILEITM